MPLDLPTMLTDALAYQADVREKIAGIENEQCSHITVEEKALLETLRQQYIHRVNMAAGFANATQDFIDSGYPIEPSLNVPVSLIEKLQKEQHAETVALTLLHGIQDAVSGTLEFSEPQEKP